MTDILQSPSHLPSSSSSITPTNNDGFHQQTFLNHDPLINNVPVDLYSRNCREIQRVESVGVAEAEEGEELSVLALLLTVLRKSLVGCKNTSGENCGVEEKTMEIGWPTNVRHIAHVTFDRFNGFLGLPVEFEPEVPRRPPSASTRVFGVSTESMQLSFDPRGNCVPTILLMMQRRLYLQGGLQYEGIFRINPENGQEEYVREQLNNGVIPENIDVHCLAGLLKAWFRELPSGILDSLPPEQVMEAAQSEEECSRLVGLLPPTEAALMDWAINLMADVAQFEHFNKMNARNIAMVFAPNMTKMSDPLTALMYAVQVMNFLKTLVVKTLREREECVVEAGPMVQAEPSDEDGHYSNSNPRNNIEANEESEGDEAEAAKVPLLDDTMSSTSKVESRTGDEKSNGFLTSIENILVEGKGDQDNRPAADHIPHSLSTMRDDGVECVNAAATIRKPQPRIRRGKSNPDDMKKGSSKPHAPRRVVLVHSDETAEKKKDASAVSRVNSNKERVEAWR
ncbi:Rho GTPase activating protein with PAK-box/P21-Rho-binding domain-containing protein [Perilla frutescens var. frutescens]|nr:Rho GTPase activating protein with PAK-box/P21-Rho-binding domain-containing protein [Perilla frutescens var. frutescens]